MRLVLKAKIAAVLLVLILIALMFQHISLTRSSPETYGPRLDELYGYIVESPSAQRFQLETGGADIWFDIREPVVVMDLEDEGFTVLHESESFQFYYIAFNMRDQLNPSGGGGRWRTSIGGNDALYYTYSGAQYENYVPLDDQAFRHALAHLIPKAEIEAVVYGGVTASAINSTVPEEQWEWYKPVDGHPFSRDTANQTLYDAGYVWQAGAPNPVLGSTPAEYWGEAGNWIDPHTSAPMNHITFAGVTQTIAPDSWGRDDLCAREFQAIGLPIEHVEVSFSYLTDIMMDYHEFDMYALDWTVGRFPDHLYGFFHSSQDMIEGYNLPGIHDLALDALLETVQFSTDRAAVKAACWDAQDMIAEKLPYIVTVTRPSIAASAAAGAPGHTDTLQGIVNSPGYGQRNDWTFYGLHWASMETPGNPLGIGGDVYYLVGSVPTNYHPGYANTVDEWSVISRLFDGLINVDPYTHYDIPWLATSWTIEDWDDPGLNVVDGMNITFYLRDDVYWHDGVEFNASSVEFSLEFARDQQIGKAFPMWQHLVDVEVQDAYTVSVYHNATSLWTFYHVVGPDVWQVNDAACWATMFPEHIYAGTDPTFRPEETVNPINPELTCLIGTGPFVYRDLGMPPLGGAAHLVAYRPEADPTMGLTTHWFMSVEEINALMTEMFHWIGDVNRDGVVDVFDLGLIGHVYGFTSEDPEYDADRDLTNGLGEPSSDGFIDIYDIVWTNIGFGKQRTYPNGGGGGGGGSSSQSIGEETFKFAGGERSEAAEPTMYVDPPEIVNYTLKINDLFSIDIDIANVTDLMGYDFKLRFNSTILNAVSVTPGDFFGAESKVWHNKTNNAVGFVRFAMTPKEGTKQGVSGSGRLATIEFQVQDYGNCSMKIKGSTKLANSCAIKIIHLTLDGLFNNTKPEEALGDVNRDGVVDIYDLSIAGKAYGSVVGDPLYNPEVDINKDGIIEMRDLAAIGKKWGWIWETDP